MWVMQKLYFHLRHDSSYSGRGSDLLLLVVRKKHVSRGEWGTLTFPSSSYFLVCTYNGQEINHSLAFRCLLGLL